jgi:hypothetical protein
MNIREEFAGLGLEKANLHTGDDLKALESASAPLTIN